MRARLLTLLVCLTAGSSVHAADGDGVQAPEITPPQRASLAGAYAQAAPHAGALDRGAFNLPGPFNAPTDRGQLEASIFPSYSPDAGLSEWGMGWRAALEIHRWRVAGDLDYAGDDLMSPWGRLVRGQDGAYWVDGLATLVRVENSAAGELTARLPDGSRWIFGGVATAAIDRDPTHRYAWYLRDIVDALGRHTQLTWKPNASGRPFLQSVEWGGTGPDTQYRIALTYEPHFAFVDFSSGRELDLDQRVQSVTVQARAAGAWKERWHYVLSYQQESNGVAFYLAQVQQVFASGEQPPPARYAYTFSSDRLGKAAFARLNELDPVIAKYGADAIDAERSSLADVDADGRLDLEDHATNTLLQRTDAGFVEKALPSPGAGAVPQCRPAAFSPMPELAAPRELARLRPGDVEPRVVATSFDAGAFSTQLDFCSRPGDPVGKTTVAGYWELGPLTRLADVNRDHRPDLVSVSGGLVTVVENTSTTAGYAFGATHQDALLPADFQPAAVWVHDLNGDGIPDLIGRDTAQLVVWYGRGNFSFDPNGVTFGVVTAYGFALPSLDGYGVYFADANRDGLADLLLTSGGQISLFVNTGALFEAEGVPALDGLGPDASRPVVGDLAGSGNVEIAVVRAGHVESVALDEPGTGLLALADDGRGNLVRFSYGRSPATPLLYHRPVVVSQVRVDTTGTDSLSYAYSYARPVAHTVGQYFAGFGGVTRNGTHDQETSDFIVDDDHSGVLTGSTNSDTLAPGAVQYESRDYDAVTVSGVPWLRVRTSHAGWRKPDGSGAIEEVTRFVNWEADVCPSRVERQSSAGTLITENTRASLSAFAGHLHCLESRIIRTGKHGDASLDFRHEKRLERNAAGLITKITEVAANGTSVVKQQAIYNSDGTLATLYSPKSGTTSLSWAPATGLLTKLTAPDGVVTSVADRDPVTDQLRATTIAHGALSYGEWFRYDGQERFARRWNSLGTSSETNPLEQLTYRYATSTLPAATSSHAAVDLASGSAVDEVALTTAGGDPLATVHRAPTSWTVDGLTKHVRATGETSRSVRAPLGTATDPLALDAATLFAGAQPVASQHDALGGLAVDTLTRFHSDVQRQTSSTRQLLSGAMVESETENGALTVARSLDAQRRSLAYQDQEGHLWRFTWDVLGRVRAVTLPDGTGHRLYVDDFGRTRRIARDGVALLDYAYQPATGLLSSVTWSTPAGAPMRSVAYQYDGTGRKLSEVHTDLTSHATASFRWWWDGATPQAPSSNATPGLLTAVSGDTWQRRFTWRADGLVAERVTDLAGWRTLDTFYEYTDDGHPHATTTLVKDAAGKQLSSTRLQDGYDAWGRLSTVALDGAPMAQLAYEADGLVESVQLATGEVVSFSYDSTTRLPVGLAQASAKISAQNAWRMNPRGRVAGETLGLGAQSVARSYDYSARGFLTASSDPSETFSYGYDAVGLKTPPAGGPLYQLDGLGRVVQRGDVELVYGPTGQVEQAQHGADKFAYVYDENGQRLLKLANGVPVEARTDEGFLDANGLAVPFSVGKRLVGLVRGGQFVLAPLDRLGTTMGELDGTQRLASPYGDRAVHPQLAAALDYVQKGFDADLGLVRMGVRDYDPALGRFLQPDPYFLEHPDKCVESPVECNLYSYALNDPVDKVDPTGQCFDGCTVSVAVAGGLAVLAIGTYIYFHQPDNARNAGRAIEDGYDRVRDWIHEKTADTAKTAERADSIPDVRWSPRIKGEEQGHHTIPRALMEIMVKQGALNPAVGAYLVQYNRMGLMNVDRQTHLALHKALTMALIAQHPALLVMTNGFQTSKDWQSYVNVLKAEGNVTPGQLRDAILKDFAGFYIGLLPIVPTAGGWESPALKFSMDAAAIKAGGLLTPGGSGDSGPSK